MNITFYDDPLEGPKAREDVRLKNLAVYVYPDKRRVAVGFDLTPFLERPSIEVTVVNAKGQPAGSLTIIETLEANFSLTMHLRDPEPTDLYELTAVLYYATPESERVNVHSKHVTFDVNQAGEQ
jgi:hypothetical protein